MATTIIINNTKLERHTEESDDPTWYYCTRIDDDDWCTRAALSEMDLRDLGEAIKEARKT